MPLEFYVNSKDPTHGQKQHQFFNLVHVIYERTLFINR